MGKVAWILVFVAIGTFALSVVRVLNPSGVLAGILFGGSVGALLFIIGPIWIGKLIYRQMEQEQRMRREAGNDPDRK